jgi:nitrogen fixation protein NifU and related proteins
MSLADLYQQLILDHAREQHGHGLRDTPAGMLAGQSRQVNPLCGDEVTLRVAVRGDGSAEAMVVEDVSWVGEGCSISQAATSVLHDLVVGLTVAQTEERLTGYREMIRSRGQAVPDEELLGDAVAFAGVGRHANRVKCAMLGWTALEAALQQVLNEVRRPDGTASRPGSAAGRVPVEEAG